jgi:acetylcholinesterase
VGGITESAFFPTQPLVSELEFQFERFTKDAECAGDDDKLTCLRSKDTLTLQAANKPSPYPQATRPPNFYFTPCIDGDFIQDYPILLFEQGKFVRRPIIFGDDENEGSSFAANASTPVEVAAFMVNQFPHLAPIQTDDINAKYPLMAALPQHAPYFPSASAAYGESTFTCPSIIVLQSYIQYFDPYKVWSYRVTIQQTDLIESGIGFPHAFEVG